MSTELIDEKELKPAWDWPDYGSAADRDRERVPGMSDEWADDDRGDTSEATIRAQFEEDDDYILIQTAINIIDSLDEDRPVPEILEALSHVRLIQVILAERKLTEIETEA